MTAFRIAPQQALAPSKKTAPVKDKEYLDWIRELPCLVELKSPVEAAHLSKGDILYGHLGRGKGTKAGDRWALPLSKIQHEAQHTVGEMRFWRALKINPYLAALSLHGLWTDLKDDATPIAIRMITTRVIGRVN